ncbi:alpha/beta-hydrolase [Lophium mytilinum]|uniref:Alpha/beta-hydrolase n=1 Tax=Lophium mytilinum TaxID=390894 RepID=A0A6A6QA78_9PEZI|nr:alpha/beta-hydrolase [Lophium mytilinum]
MSSSANEKPTIVVVQGSFQTPDVYKSLRDGLETLGYSTIHPNLPSLTNQDHPDFAKKNIIDDALAIRVELIRQIEYERKTVVLVMHSYGGLVGSEAVPEELSYTYRQARGLPGGVVHLFYFSAFILAEDQSVLGVFGESTREDIRPDGTYCIKNAAEVLYNDLPDADAKLWESRLVYQSYAVNKTKLTRAAYRYIPSTYLVCENDKAAPPQYQESFAASAGATVNRCAAGHSAMLSHTDMLASKIAAVADKAISSAVPKS